MRGTLLSSGGGGSGPRSDTGSFTLRVESLLLVLLGPAASSATRRGSSERDASPMLHEGTQLWSTPQPRTWGSTRFSIASANFVQNTFMRSEFMIGFSHG